MALRILAWPWHARSGHAEEIFRFAPAAWCANKATPRKSGVAMPLDRCGAQVASQQSPILRNGKVQSTLALFHPQEVTKRVDGTDSPQTDPQIFYPAPERCRAASLSMLLAQSDKSQGFGDGVPKNHRCIQDLDEPGKHAKDRTILLTLVLSAFTSAALSARSRVRRHFADNGIAHAADAEGPSRRQRWGLLSRCRPPRASNPPGESSLGTTRNP